MQLITDLDQLKTLSAQRRDDFEVMLYQLQDDNDLTDETIDAVAKRLAEPIVEAIDCTECANCCRSIEVQLGEDDLERLSSGINIPLSEIHTLVETQDEHDPDIVGIFKQHPCTFLDRTLCTVYEYRPTSCRDYPTFTPDFRWMLSWMIEGTSMCPIIYNVLVAMLDEVDNLQRNQSDSATS